MFLGWDSWQGTRTWCKHGPAASKSYSSKVKLSLIQFSWADYGVSFSWQIFDVIFQKSDKLTVKLIKFVMWQNHLMARGPELSLWIAEGRSGRYQFSIQLHPSFSLLLLGQQRYFLRKGGKERQGGATGVSISNTWHKIHSCLYLLSGLIASNHILMPLPCFHAPFCGHLLASDKRKLQAGICKCTECWSCSIPHGINGISSSSANGGEQPRMIPLRHELVWITYPVRTLGGQRSFGKATLLTSLSKPAKLV